MSGLVYVANPSGHRAEYQSLFAVCLGLSPVSGPAPWRNLIAAERLLFATIDDDLAGYALVAVLRAVRGRKTVGLFLRPHACMQSGFKAWIKRSAFRLLRRIPGISTLSVMPTDLVPAQADIVTGWVHDPQLWDLYGRKDEIDPVMHRRLHGIAGGRPVLAFLGQIAPIKGFSLLTAMIEARPDLARQFCIVVAGPISDDSRPALEALLKHGVTQWPHRIDDAEMAAIYHRADLVWACYDPSYDQASGIFGRALQRGRMTIIREGAMLEHYARWLEHPYIALPYEPAEAARRLAEAAIKPALPSSMVAQWHCQNIETLKAALQ